jgi:hypothetical protein
MDEALRLQLLAMRDLDLETRERLAADGSLFQGYHPDMRAVHEANAAALMRILDRHGWPTAELAGEDGAEAAWLIVQHAISLPDFCRRCLGELKRLAEAGAVPRWQPAYLEDRIRVFEGRPQLYGTSFDWDEEGLMSPMPIEDPGSVDSRRAEIGLGTLAEAIERHRVATKGDPKPTNLEARREEIAAWARQVGWR